MWTFYDPVLAVTYSPPIGPDRMTSPFSERSLTSRATTSHRGQAITWQGSPTPVAWSFSGRLLTQAHYEALQAWYAKPNRIRITDHLTRTYECFITDFSPEPQRAGDNFWSHRYTMSTLNFGRVS